MSIELTSTQAKSVTRELEFSVHFPMKRLMKSFPSVTFVYSWGNAGVTNVYEVSGPKVWVDKIERKYVYPS